MNDTTTCTADLTAVPFEHREKVRMVAEQG